MSLFFALLIGYLSKPFFSVAPIMGFACGVFLLFASWEFNPRELLREFPLALKLWFGAFFIPFFSGLILVFTFPQLFESSLQTSVTTTALIVGISLAVSAVPVVIKIMQELNWGGSVRSRIVVLTAILCDVTAWLLFLPLLPISGQLTWLSSHLVLFIFIIGLVVSYLWPKILDWQPKLSLVNKWLVAPIFFIGVGQTLSFSDKFNFKLTLIIFVVATVSKFVGVWISAKFAQIKYTERYAIALALNSRGAMEIIMATFALKAELISYELYLSLVIMAIATSLMIKPFFHLGLLKNT